MLALALAESAQQVSIQSQSSEHPTPVSPLQPQDTSTFQDSPHPLVPHCHTSEEEVSGRGSPQPSNSTAATVTPGLSYPPNSSPTVKQQPLELTSTITKPSESAKSSTTPPVPQPEMDSTPPDNPLYKCVPLPSSTSLTSPTRKSPERQQPVTGQVPVHTSSSSTTPATTPSGNYKDTGVSPQPVPEVGSYQFHMLIGTNMTCIWVMCELQSASSKRINNLYAV